MLYRLTIVDIVGGTPALVYESGDLQDIYLALRNNGFTANDVLLALTNDYKICEVWKDLNTKAVLERFL